MSKLNGIFWLLLFIISIDITDILAQTTDNTIFNQNFNSGILQMDSTSTDTSSFNGFFFLPPNKFEIIKVDSNYVLRTSRSTASNSVLICVFKNLQEPTDKIIMKFRFRVIGNYSPKTPTILAGLPNERIPEYNSWQGPNTYLIYASLFKDTISFNIKNGFPEKLWFSAIKANDWNEVSMEYFYTGDYNLATVSVNGKSQRTPFSKKSADFVQAFILGQLVNYDVVSRIIDFDDIIIRKIPVTRIMSIAGSLNFYPTGIGSSYSRYFRVYNSGNSVLKVSSMSFPECFSPETGAPYLYPGEYKDVDVSFAPQEARKYSGTIYLHSNKTEGTDTINVSGTGLPSSMAIINVNVSSDYKSHELTRPGFSANTSIFDHPEQPGFWGNINFQSKTSFGKYLRLPIKNALDENTWNNIKNAIEHSTQIGREVILLIDLKTIINEYQLKYNLYKLKKYFDNNSIKWFELGTEVWKPQNFNYSGGDFSDIIKEYANRISMFVPVIKAIQPNAGIMVCAAEGNYISDTLHSMCEWSKDLLNELDKRNVAINAFTFHLYPSESKLNNSFNSTSPYRYLALGKSVADKYITPFSKKYEYEGGLIKLFREKIIKNRNIDIFCTEYSITPDKLLEANLRKGFFNALVYSSTYSYLANDSVKSFLLHQFGEGSSPDEADGWNCVNGSENNIPVSYAVKMISAMQKYYVNCIVKNSISFSTRGNNILDSAGAIPVIDNIPYLSVAAGICKTGDSLTILITNTSSENIFARLNFNGFDYGDCSLNINYMTSDSYIKNNDDDLLVFPKRYPFYLFSYENFKIPAYSIMLLTNNKVSVSICINDEKKNYELFQNYPNPFNSSTNIKYTLSKDAHVSIIIYNVLGEVVEKITDEYKISGNYIYQWNPKNIPGGVYYYRCQIDNNVSVKKMLLLK
jgi:hypothetical protein